jgi:hypothetical protein
MNWKWCRRKLSWPDVSPPGICLYGLRKSVKIPYENAWSPGRDWNPQSPECEVGTLTTGPRPSQRGVNWLHLAHGTQPYGIEPSASRKGETLWLAEQLVVLPEGSCSMGLVNRSATATFCQWKPWSHVSTFVAAAVWRTPQQNVRSREFGSFFFRNLNLSYQGI